MQTGSSTGDRAVGTGYERVDGRISSVLTRFRLRSVFSLPLFYLAFRRIRKHAQVPGLLKTAFMIESARTCYTLSLWSDEGAIVEFNKKVIHVAMANWSFRHIYRRDIGGAEVWSVHWKLFAVSNNLNWGDFNLRELLKVE
jgi:hypothetical protein